MFIYIIAVFIIISLGMLTKPYNNKKNVQFFLGISFIILSGISALRSYHVGVDTEQYYNAFLRIANLNLNQISLLRYEYGFTFLCWILSKMTINPQILIIVTSIFINFVIFNFIKKNSDNVLISVLVYIFLNFYFSYMNVMRQALAICFILIGYEFLKKNKNISFILFCFFGMLFHESAILALLFLILKKFKANRKNFVVVIFLIILSFIYGNRIFDFFALYSPRLMEYVNSKFYVSNYFGSLLDALVYIVLYIFGIKILLNHNYNILNNKNSTEKFLMWIIGVACVFQTLVIRVSIFNRFSPYFSVFLIIWIPNFLSKIKDKRKCFFMNVIVIFFLMLYWLIIMIFRPNWYGTVPYSLFF